MTQLTDHEIRQMIGKAAGNRDYPEDWIAEALKEIFGCNDEYITKRTAVHLLREITLNAGRYTLPHAGNTPGSGTRFLDLTQTRLRPEEDYDEDDD